MRRRRPERARRAGTILIVTMWILIVLAAMVLVLAGSMRIEGDCSANHAARQQAAAVESGAIQYLIANLDGLAGQVPDETAMLSRGVQVGHGAFWLLRPDYDDGREEVYGVVDEAAKVNLNVAGEDMLSALPGMTPETAAAIVDWRDGDSDLTVGGAESEYYLLLPDPYECKNAPLETVEELLLIREMTPDLLFGEDTNRNGRLDENEDDANETDPGDNRDGKLDAGVGPLVTVYSSEPNTSSSGSQRLNVNRARTSELSNALGKVLQGNRRNEVLSRARLGRPFANLLDFYFRTGLTQEEFAGLADQLTTDSGRTLRGKINAGTAPKQVLQCLPDLEESDAAALIAARSGENVDRRNIAWVVSALPQEKAVAIGSFLTARSYQFSADIVSVAGNGRAFRRCRVVIDAGVSPPRIVYRQDLTSLGWPLDPAIVDALRSGTPLEQVLDETSQEAW